MLLPLIVEPVGPQLAHPLAATTPLPRQVVALAELVDEYRAAVQGFLGDGTSKVGDARWGTPVHACTPP
jgi:hypothetical protein